MAGEQTGKTLTDRMVGIAHWMNPVTSDPAAPLTVGSFNAAGSATVVQVVGHLAYVALGSQGLQIVDVTNPAAPAAVGHLDTSHKARDLEVVGDRVYVADGGSGLHCEGFPGAL